MLDGRSKVVLIETFICVGVHTCARALPTRERCVAPLRGATHALIGGLGSDASRRYPIETRDEPADSCRLVIPIRHRFGTLNTGVRPTQACTSVRHMENKRPNISVSFWRDLRQR